MKLRHWDGEASIALSKNLQQFWHTVVFGKKLGKKLSDRCLCGVLLLRQCTGARPMAIYYTSSRQRHKKGVKPKPSAAPECQWRDRVGDCCAALRLTGTLETGARINRGIGGRPVAINSSWAAGPPVPEPWSRDIYLVSMSDCGRDGGAITITVRPFHQFCFRGLFAPIASDFVCPGSWSLRP